MDWTIEEIEDWREEQDKYFRENDEFQGGTNFIMSGYYACEYRGEICFDCDYDD